MFSYGCHILYSYQNTAPTPHPLFKNCFIESNPIPAKCAMALLGLMENELRLPLVPATAATEAIMKQTLDELWQK